MMGALAEPDRTRLIRLLGMLGSDHIGERANAGSLAHRLLLDNKLTWDDVIPRSIGLPGNGASYARQKPPEPVRNWRDVVGECLENDDLLSAWERNFLENLTQWRGMATPKQMARLQETAERLGVPWPP